MDERWRQGRKVGHHLYRQTCAEPADTDPWIGSFVDPHDAEMAVAAMNNADRLLAIDRDLTDLVDHWNTPSIDGIQRVCDPRLTQLLDRLAAELAEIDR